MSEEKPPLKPVVEPDEYLCTWLLPGPDDVIGEYAGALNLRPGRAPIGSVHGNVPLRWNESPGGRNAGFPQESRLPHLRARLANGYDADLVDVHVSYWSAQHGRISAASATVGHAPGPRGFGWDVGSATETEDTTAEDTTAEDTTAEDTTAEESLIPTYPRIDIQVGALDAIAGVSPFSGWRFPPQGSGRHLEGDWSVSGNPESSQEWSDDDATFRLEYDAAIGVGDQYAYRFVVSPVVRIESKEALTVSEWIERWVTPLRAIASIATSSAQPLTYLAVDPSAEDGAVPRKYRRRQVFGSGITQEPYQSDGAAVHKAATVVYIAADGLSLLDMVRRWQRLVAEHHPLIETYGAMLSATEDHPRSRFLLLVQALEGLYGHQDAEAYEERQARHTVERDAVLEAVKPAEVVNAAQRKFLKDNLSKHPPRGLDQALRSLLEGLPVDLTPRLAACELFREYLVEATGPEVQRVAFVVSKVRNDLAHGNRGYDAYKLHEAVRVLERAEQP